MDFTPNHIPPRERWFYGLLSAALLLYSAYGVIVDDLYIPVLGMTSVIVDHFDNRNNETNYRLFAKVMTWGAWTLFIAGSVLWLIGAPQ